MFIRRALILLLFVAFQSGANARSWESIKIPGAKCGNGSDYHVWVDHKHPRKLAIELMGGGACWSKETCFGSSLRAWIFPFVRFPLMSVFSSELPSLSPAHDASMIYFPYCTGDVHVGNHTADYQGKTIYHWGYRNIGLGLQYLQEQGIIAFDQVEELLLYGASAGALGSIAHSRLIEMMLPVTAKKTLIADSPGLHFGAKFWDKFSDQMFEDIKDAYSELAPLQRGVGIVAPYIKQICRRRASWNIGVLQASKDIVMSKLFGEISQEDHERLVYGEQGIYNMSKGTGNCSAFVPRGSWHTFLVTYPTARVEAGGISANQYLFEVASGRMNTNYRSN